MNEKREYIVIKRKSWYRISFEMILVVSKKAYGSYTEVYGKSFRVLTEGGMGEKEVDGWKIHYGTEVEEVMSLTNEEFNKLFKEKYIEEAHRFINSKTLV